MEYSEQKSTMKTLITVSLLFVIAANPLSQMAQEHKPALPALARIDVHTHVFNPTPAFYALLNRLNLRVLNICVLDKHNSRYQNLNDQQTAAIEAFRASLGRAAWCSSFDFDDWESSEFA